MLVQCPKCRTTYRVSDEILKGSAPAFRCSRCKHTFELDAQSAAQAAPIDEADAVSSEIPAKVEELKLPFESKTAALKTFESAKPSPHEDAPLAEEDAARRQVETEAWSMSDPGKDEDQPFVMPGNDPSTESDKELDRSLDFSNDDPFFPKTVSEDDSVDSNNILALSSYLDQRASIFPFITLFGLLVIGFSLVAVISYAHPQASAKLLKQIPLVGDSVLKNERVKDGIAIQSLSSGYQTIQGNREVFLVTGIAVNQNPVVVREIRLSGIAYDDAGKELERQTIWAGNTISPKILRGMTAEDIPHLQNLKPLKSFEVPAGDSIPFTIVFLRSVKNAKQFSCEVVAAEGDV